MSTAAIATNCQSVTDRLEAYLDHKLKPAEMAEIQAHLECCADCHECIQYSRAVHGLLEYIQIDPAAALQDDEAEPGFFEKMQAALSAAPWWGVSVALHALVLTLAGLLSMSIKMPASDDVIMVTEIHAKPITPDVKEIARRDDALESKVDVPPTDPNSKEHSNIVVPPDILQQAALGDHFETVNPDRPDTESAFGTADAQMFHSARGDDDVAGGGGAGGAALEGLIGIGGAAGAGTGGGFGGGDGSGTGTGKGPGHGSFGNRNGGGRKLMVKKHGGSPATEGAVDAALYWLASHQEADGHWDLAKFEGKMDDARVQGINGEAAITGFAVLAFLGAGHTDRVGMYKDNVKRGLDWLCAKLLENEATMGPGRWCKNFGSNYTQGIAALALAEASGMNPSNKALRAAAQKATDGVVAGQIKTGPSDYQAWGYLPGANTNDTSVTGWNVMALKSAKIAGLHVDMMSFMGAMTWIEAGQDLTNAPGVGAAEYWEGGRMSYSGTLDKPNKGQGSPAIMSAATLTRLMVGGEKPDSPGIAGPCNLMKTAAYLPNKWPGNLYYWYYGSLTMFQKSGEHWRLWNEALKKTLTEAQRKDGDFHGSFDPLTDGAHGYIWGGRVMSTALGALCLEVYYRYAIVSRQ